MGPLGYFISEEGQCEVKIFTANFKGIQKLGQESLIWGKGKEKQIKNGKKSNLKVFRRKRRQWWNVRVC